MNRVRPAKPTDSNRIAELYAQLVDSPVINVMPERIAQLSDDPNTALFVCEHNGLVEGTALVSLCADAMFGFQPFAVVENIVVNQAHRGTGLGAALLQHIEAFCLGKDCSKIMLLSAIRREKAHRFFEREGFAGSSKRGFVKYRREFRT
ncbi:GNAT family N-acetyltransferase [Chitinolyticbacter albus]|uniref:GNAT family N-acetyltransferase n=1 Tax=Chitinolyticbacter albus TaxID=2961951 RepID=UPI00210C408D|nr:GNAT family N-acetyltransferase [Chitinolyticbacter albus]